VVTVSEREGASDVFFYAAVTHGTAWHSPLPHGSVQLITVAHQASYRPNEHNAFR